MASEHYREGLQQGREDFLNNEPKVEDDLDSPVYQKYPEAGEYARGYSDGYDQAKEDFFSKLWDPIKRRK
jgi:hypothetical protein